MKRASNNGDLSAVRGIKERLVPVQLVIDVHVATWLKRNGNGDFRLINFILRRAMVKDLSRNSNKRRLIQRISENRSL